MPIGVFDSGLGGLTILAHLRAAFPDQAFVYLGDHANAPYGTRPPEDVHGLTRAGVQRLFDEGCELVILACNTACAVALKALQEDWLPDVSPNRRVLGVFVPVIEALTGRPWAFGGRPEPAAVNTVALFATPNTIDSGAFPRELAFRATGVEIISQPCPGLVEAIEEGRDPAPLVQGFVADLLTRCPEPEAAVLGCTHYPLVLEAFEEALPDKIQIFSQGQIVADSLGAYLIRHPRFRGIGAVRFLTTGPADRVTDHARRTVAPDIHFAAA